MSLFRSEEHVERWIVARHYERGAIISLAQVWRLAKAWYKDPRDAEWRPRSLEETDAIIRSVGLTDDFWRLI